ncbi:unnamed protein product [Sphagnum balticum]
MPFYNLSPNMSLPIPEIGLDPGPDYASNLNDSLTIVDGHNHTPGYGVPVPVAGLNINADLPLNNYNITGVRSVRLSVNTSALSNGSDVNCLYDLNGDLYFIDGSGDNIQITKAGAVFATSSGITSGTASASFVNGVLVVNAAPNIPANIQAGQILLGNNTVGTNFITLSAPNALAASYTATLPPSPPTGEAALVMDQNGTITTTTGFNPAGSVIMYAGATAPSGYLICNGSAVSRTTYAALYSAIGTLYGSGDGSTTFNIPNLQGNVVVGPGGTIGAALGGTGGEASHVLTVAELAAHSHTITDPGHNHALAVDANNNNGAIVAAGNSQARTNFTANAFTGITGTNSAGSGSAHNNVQPYVSMYYIIKT